MNHCEEEKNIKDILALRPASDKNTILKSNHPITIYGAGETGRRVRALLEQHAIKIDYFLDIKGGNDVFVDNIAVVKPDAPCVDKTAYVIVAVFNNITDIIPIITLLKQIGFTKIIPYTEFFLYFADELPAHYWLGPAKLYESHIADLAAVFSLLEDRPSKELFLSLLRFRITGDPAYIPQPQTENIYFPPDIPARDKPCHFIDCGAFCGDTLISAKKRFGVLDSIRAFEPDPDNYQRLVQLNNETIFSQDTV